MKTEFRGREESGVDAAVEELAFAVIGAAIEVHQQLGSGLPETAYKLALSHELSLRGLEHEKEVAVPIHYKGVLVGEGFIDILVGRQLIVELKVVESLGPAHRAQVLSYLQATKLNLGLLINYYCPILKDGIKRIVRTR